MDIQATLHLLVSRPRCLASQIVSTIRPFNTITECRKNKEIMSE